MTVELAPSEEPGKISAAGHQRLDLGVEKQEVLTPCSHLTRLKSNSCLLTLTPLDEVSTLFS